MIEVLHIEGRTLEFNTASRAAFIDVFAALANAVPNSFLRKEAGVPLIDIAGSAALGKSLVVETMIRQWSDDLSPMDIRNPKEELDYMFLESQPCDAMDTVRGTYNVASGRTLFIFSAQTDSRNLMKLATLQITHNKSLTGGAVFLADWTLPNAIPPEQILGIQIGKPLFTQHEDWQRTIRIAACNDKLWNNEQFQGSWGELRKMAEAPAP